MDDIDFQLMMMGKVCYDELDRIKRVARKDVVQYPNFMKNINAYKKSLRKMLTLNGLDGVHPQSGPPDVYIKHLEEKKKGKTNQKGKKVRSKGSSGTKTVCSNKKGKNRGPLNKSKHEDDDDDDYEEEELKSFSCSHPFVNMHLQDKPMAEIEKLVHVEPEALRDVKELTGSITEKDNLLDKQIQKLQDILKNHQWTKAEDCSLEEGMLHPKINLVLPQINKDIEPVLSSSKCLKESFVGDSSFINESTTSNLKEDNPKSPEMITCTLCPNELEFPESVMVGEFDRDGGQSLSFQRNYSDDSVVEMKKKKSKVKSRSSSRPSSQQFLHQMSRKNTTQIQPQSRRRVLYTPVADLSSYDSMVEQTNSTQNNSNGNVPNIKKRVSLTSPKASNTKTAKTDCKQSTLLSPSPPPPVNSSENLYKDTWSQLDTQDFGQHNEFSSQCKYDCKDKDNKDQFIFCQTVMDDLRKQRNRAYDSRMPASKSRPLSTGSERILQVHWMDFPASIKVAQQQKLLHRRVLSYSQSK